MKPLYSGQPTFQGKLAALKRLHIWKHKNSHFRGNSNMGRRTCRINKQGLNNGAGSSFLLPMKDRILSGESPHVRNEGCNAGDTCPKYLSWRPGHSDLFQTRMPRLGGVFPVWFVVWECDIRI
ncbi:hypothetical protein AVEN_133046-1 [Araneus ventricosus]|uniref:Uncharacterized protein n=1 Tax=Araneus ventricosus TaxID=182803 RepID=A0A4Y2P0Y8_ARAVE|nr:hypothetical protein AVEN_30012-1 [Araneus ventricosus]GBN43706.1 hypothetical protein AVEN_133046-1 [Araneus ventricosus]